ncbi:hypothetical protein B0H14DRAFT_3434546 [Mycena olivaceomarginata]|nr:hypothetical protein B0H14DRAFT_3434546 [Mycena olivaceomarginata]
MATATSRSLVTISQTSCSTSSSFLGKGEILRRHLTLSGEIWPPADLVMQAAPLHSLYLRALDFRQEALELRPASHLKQHLEAAILNHTLALSLRPEGHSDRAVSLQGLAAAYSTRFKHFWKLRIARFVKRHPSAERPIADIEETIALFTKAKGSIPPTVPAQSRLDLHLAIVYLKQHDVQPNSGTLATGFRFFEAGFYYPSTKPWTVAHTWNGPRLRAFAAAPDGLRTIAMEAAAVAIADGQFELAVELLEQGRAILWTRMRRYRPSRDRLHDTDDALAMRFEKVSKQLEVLAVSPSEAPGDNTERRLDFDAKMKTMRVLQEEREEMAQIPRADFAFLAASSTAAGDEGTPDEAIHLAAAMQFAGFRSVVGTLWEMADQDGPFVAREFYGHVFREGSTSADFT